LFGGLNPKRQTGDETGTDPEQLTTISGLRDVKTANVIRLQGRCELSKFFIS